MHEYTIEGKGRVLIIFWIAFISIVLTPVINIFINFVLSKISSQVKDYIEIAYTLTSLTTFSLLYFLFNKFIWKLLAKILRLPNLNGKWECKGHSYNPVTNAEFDWDSEIDIKQTWAKISVLQKTKTSDSHSTSVIGSIKIEENDEIVLSYIYENTPRNNTPELLKHRGVVILRFNKLATKASGDYFNDQNRNTYGRMDLDRIS